MWPISKEVMLMHFQQNVMKLFFKNMSSMTSQFALSEKSMEEIRKHLVKFTGGSVILNKRGDGLSIIELSHDKKKNAVSGKMMVDLYDVVEELSSLNTGKGVILKGSSGNFCSGGDLDFVRQIATPEEGCMMATYMQNILNKFQRLPLISVALIEGIGKEKFFEKPLKLVSGLWVGALGGGSELSVACDFILMSENCSGIGFVHAKLGLMPAWGGTNRLIEKVGYTKTLELLSTAKILSPQECLKIGLVNDIIPANEDSENYAISWMHKNFPFNEHLLRNIKTSVSSARDFPRDFEREKRLFAPFWGGPAHVEALQKNIKHKTQS